MRRSPARSPARTLAWHRARREHRRQRREIIRLMQLVSVAIERGYLAVITHVDAKLAGKGKQ